MARRLKKDDMVVVIAGRDKGAKGRVLKVITETDRVLVEGVNIVKRHSRPSPKDPQGGIIEKEMPIHVSNVMLWDAGAEARTRVRIGEGAEGEKIRISVRSGESLEG